MNKVFIIIFFFIAFGSKGNTFPKDPKKDNEKEVLAFPGAEGYGRFTTGGRGGNVLVVTNLNDRGKGSLREAVAQSGPRIIVFEVSGTIALKSKLNIRNGDLTIAGQSAPGDGICIRNYPVSVDADNVIIRYIRVRLGDEKKQEADALGGRKQERIIIDHCSVSWSVDECASFYTNEYFTMQWCIISESLNSSVHQKGRHGYGAIWGGNHTTFHHNLLANHLSRNPRFSGSKYDTDIPNRQLDYRNNVIYNWGINSAYGNEDGEVNMINNYYKPGPATPDKLRDRIVNPSKPYGKFYVSGNYVEGAGKVNDDNWSGGVQCDNIDAVYHKNAFEAAPVTTESAQEAYPLILKYAGASLQRDVVDNRVIMEVENGESTYKGSVTGIPGIIDSQKDVGGWPELKSAPAPKDQDRDGMPDQWEEKYQLNPNDASDATGHQVDAPYTNIEAYLNSLVAEITQNQISRKYDFVVAKDGTGDFQTVQAAVDAVPDMRKQETRIYIKNGIYKEKLVLPASKTNVNFVGEDVKHTIITYNDFASKKNKFGEEIGTSGSSGFYVFGEGFMASNITFENSSGPVGQAVAVRIDGDKVSFNNCHFLGFQDTLYPHGERSRQYYKNCYIEGTTDFIFGWSTAVFEDCQIFSKEGGSYITAASTTDKTEFGFVFINCKLTGDAPENSVYLGRPWRPFAQTVFINCDMGKHIKPEGWHNWNKPGAEGTSFYGEYNSSGPGAKHDDRVKWSHQLTNNEAGKYALENIFKDWHPKEKLNKNQENR